jgi:hypothetical protein
MPLKLVLPKGTNRSFPPLPITRTTPVNRSICLKRNPTNSDTLSPVAYRTNNIKSLRDSIGVGLVFGISKLSTSLTVKVCGSFRYRLGISNESKTFFEAMPSIHR